jgi:uncharacterized protein HemX
MNRRKSEPEPSRTPASVFVALILAAAIAAGGGVLHAFYKNRQVQVAREIDAAERRIGQYQLDIQTIRMRMDERLNRFAIRQELEDNGSTLRPIPVGLIEEVDPAPRSPASVAAAVH